MCKAVALRNRLKEKNDCLSQLQAKPSKAKRNDFASGIYKEEMHDKRIKSKRNSDTSDSIMVYLSQEEIERRSNKTHKLIKTRKKKDNIDTRVSREYTPSKSGSTITSEALRKSSPHPRIK